MTRVRIWAIRRKARVLSKYTRQSVIARLDNFRVGEFKRGREVK